MLYALQDKALRSLATSFSLFGTLKPPCCEETQTDSICGDRVPANTDVPTFQAEDPDTYVRSY